METIRPRLPEKHLRMIALNAAAVEAGTAQTTRVSKNVTLYVTPTIMGPKRQSAVERKLNI